MYSSARIKNCQWLRVWCHTVAIGSCGYWQLSRVVSHVAHVCTWLIFLCCLILFSLKSVSVLLSFCFIFASTYSFQNCHLKSKPLSPRQTHQVLPSPLLFSRRELPDFTLGTSFAPGSWNLSPGDSVFGYPRFLPCRVAHLAWSM